MQYEKASLRRCFFDAVCPAKLDYTCRCKSGHGNRRLSRKTNDQWTKAEEKILKKYYPVEGGNVYKRLNNRTRNACISKAAQLHLQYGLHLRLECDETGKFRVYEDSVLLDEKEYDRQQIENLADTGVEYVTLYAFSTENWKRSKEEVDALMELLCEFIDANLSVMIEKGLRLMVTGRMWGLPEKSQEYLRLAIEKTASNRRGTLILALNYGGRAEIVDTAKKIVQDVMNGKLSIENINEKTFAERMYLPEVPDPDLLIRTSGELRLSNFLLWELSYSEIYVTDTLWPDFDMEELRKAVSAYGRRNRRFGGRK